MFEWDEEEDTQKDAIPLLTIDDHLGDDAVFRPQFGRGFLAGYDRGTQIKTFKHKDVDQKKVAVKTKEDKVILEQIEDAERDVKHWTDKALEDMDERDWRIFKEDFNITTKGTNIKRSDSVVGGVWSS